ncbi:hypothetical protein BD626DRAFT_524571, partial [Schizophyllum amplum]
MGRRRWWLTFVTTPATSFRSAALWSSGNTAARATTNNESPLTSISPHPPGPTTARGPPSISGPRAATRRQSAQRITPHVRRLAHTRTHNFTARSATTNASYV